MKNKKVLQNLGHNKRTCQKDFKEVNMSVLFITKFKKKTEKENNTQFELDFNK